MIKKEWLWINNLNKNKMENNKLIAEFMGLQFSKGEYYRPLYNSGDWTPENELQYHTSWDWLMPVISKITRDEEYLEDDYREHLMDIVPYGHIEDTYDAVVTFITEHNKNLEYESFNEAPYGEQ